MIRSNSSGFVPGAVLVRASRRTARCPAGTRAPSRGTGRRRRRAAPCAARVGGTIAQARSSTAERVRRDGRGLVLGRQPDLDHGGRVGRVVDVVDRDVRPALRVQHERPRLAQLAVRVQLDPPLDHLEAQVRHRDERRVRQARSARSARPARRSPGCSGRGRPGARGPAPRACRSGPSRAPRPSPRGSPRRRTGPPARRRAAGRRPGRPTSEVAAIEAIACFTRPRSDVPLATTLAVRPAAITLTLPPAGRSLSASIASRLRRLEAVRRDVGRLHRRGGVDDEHDVAGEPRRPLHERTSREEREDQDQQQLEQQQQAPPELLPRRVRLDVRDQPAATAAWTARRPRPAGA